MTFQISLMSITAQTLRPNVNDLFGRCRSKGNLCVVIFYVSPPQNPAINPDPSIYHRGQQTEMPAMYPVYVLPWPTFCLFANRKSNLLGKLGNIFQVGCWEGRRTPGGRRAGAILAERGGTRWADFIYCQDHVRYGRVPDKSHFAASAFLWSSINLCSLLRERAGGVTELKDQNFSAFYLDSELIENLKPWTWFMLE